jgi:predicted acylesterase/phospholipase RssA
MKESTERLTWPALVLLTQEAGLDAPLGTLTRLLAQTIVADFDDDVVVLELDGDGAPQSSATKQGVVHISLRAPAEFDAALAALLDELAVLARRAAYVLLDVSRRPVAFQLAIAERLALADLGDLTGRLVHLTRSRATPAFAGWSELRTEVLAPQGDAPAAAGLRNTASATRSLVRKEMERLTGVTEEPRGERSPDAKITPEVCRIRLDPAALGKLDPPSLSGLAAPLRASLSRWARAVTDRRVGVALGGSGSWGYAHVALLDALDGASVPIDLIGSASSGSLMGAYYAVLGRPGLALAVQRGREFQLMAMAAIFSSASIEHRLDIDLGLTRIDDLEILFFPVAINLTSASPELVTSSTVGFGVRASGTAPGFFAATRAKDALYVDGAVMDNVPALMLERMGAALVVAANALPPPHGVRAEIATTRFRALLSELNPLRRATDLIASLSLMLHDAGDVPTSATRVLFDPPPQRAALFRTFEFSEAEEIIKHVKTEPEFNDTVSATVAAWDALRGPRKARTA